MDRTIIVTKPLPDQSPFSKNVQGNEAWRKIPATGRKTPMSAETRKYSIAADFDRRSDISADSDAMVEYLTYLAYV